MIIIPYEKECIACELCGLWHFSFESTKVLCITLIDDTSMEYLELSLAQTISVVFCRIFIVVCCIFPDADSLTLHYNCVNRLK